MKHPNDEPDELPILVEVQQWRCPNCGQHIFTQKNEEPPDICDYCADMTTWETTDGST